MRFLLLVALLVGFPVLASAEELGSVKTAFHFTGSDTIVIEAFDDPAVDGVTCHLSRAKTGGIGGYFGLAEDKSDASIACRQIGPITVNIDNLPKQDEVFKVSTSPLFKKMRVVRFVDSKRKTLVYLTYSDHLVDGSPKNAISSVPVQTWGK